VVEGGEPDSCLRARARQVKAAAQLTACKNQQQRGIPASAAILGLSWLELV